MRATLKAEGQGGLVSGTVQPVGSANAIKLLIFAGAREVLGTGELSMPLHAPCTASALLDEICHHYPALSPYRRSIRVAVNGTYACADDLVSAGDEVALIPPVAGG